MERDVRRSPTAARVERNGEGLQAEGAANSNAVDLEKGRKAVASDVQVKVGLGLKRSRAVTLDGSGTEKSTIRLRDQGNVNYPVSSNPGCCCSCKTWRSLCTRSGLNRGGQLQSACCWPAYWGGLLYDDVGLKANAGACLLGGSYLRPDTCRVLEEAGTAGYSKGAASVSTENCNSANPALRWRTPHRFEHLAASLLIGGY